MSYSTHCSRHLIAVIAALMLFASSRATFAAPVPVNDPGDVITPSTTLNASSTILGFPGVIENAHAIDGLLRGLDQGATNGLIFANGGGGTNERLSLSGFIPSSIIDIRIFVVDDAPRMPTSVNILSSTSVVTTLNPGDYETTLATAVVPSFTGGPPTGTDEMYADISVLSPTGTQSLFFEFTSASGTRISEIEAISVPEPASASLLFVAVACLAAKRRRHNRCRTAQ